MNELNLLYCQELMMVFDAHQNVQRVIETAWSFYLLKYALKVSAVNACQSILMGNIYRLDHV